VEPGLGETCDPPGSIQFNGNACRANCTFCGDKIVQPGEQCDDGNTNQGCPTSQDNCTNTCTFPICHDPASIHFWPRPLPDEWKLRATIKAEPEALNDPSASMITLTIENANGVVYSAVLEPGDLTQDAASFGSFSMADATARYAGGVSTLIIRRRPQAPSIIYLRAFGDFSGATLAEMRTTVTIGDQAFMNQGPWRKLPNGWFAGHFQRLQH
jgi:cysteine-rich repeat protein